MKSVKVTVKRQVVSFLDDPIGWISQAGCGIIWLLLMLSFLVPLGVDLVKEIIAAFK